MKPLPLTDHPLVLRTHFDDQIGWDAVRAGIREPDGDFPFFDTVVFLDDVAYKDVDAWGILADVPEEYAHSFLFIADGMTCSSSDHGLLVLDLSEPTGRMFRAIPSCVQEIEMNLSIANTDFEGYLEAVDQDGVYRGYPNG